MIDEIKTKAPKHRIDAIEQAESYYRDSLVGPALQKAPTPEIAARLIFGEKPSDIAPGLTKKEAAAWVLQNVHETPEEWLWRQAVEQFPELSISHSKSIPVIRWAMRMLKSPKRKHAMSRPRVLFGERQTDAASVLARLDEISLQDLSDSPRETLQRALTRRMKEEWDGPEELLKHAPWMDDLPDGVTVIRTWQELYLEGLEMRHCVADYAEDIYSGQAVIISLRTEDSRSTAEYNSGKLVQHQGLARSIPHHSCVALAQKVERCLQSS